jgi:hypothetical protein
MNVRNEGSAQRHSDFSQFHSAFSDKAVIMPPEAIYDTDVQKRYTRVIVDSKDRNTQLFPNPNIYEIALDDDIEDVLTAELININIPFTQYLVNNTYKTFQVIRNSTTYDVVLPIGDYSATDLAQVTATTLNAIENIYDVQYSSLTDNFVFKASQPFTIIFPTPIAKLYGYDINKPYASTASGSSPFTQIVKAPFRKDFAYNDYIVMTIDQFDINKSTNNQLLKSFALLSPTMNSTQVASDQQVKKRFSPPLARLHKLRIKFYDRFGNPYDFQNSDHYFQILFESYKQKRKYQNIFRDR